MRRAATAALLLAAVDSFPSDLLKDDCAKGVLLVDGGLLPPIMGIPPTVDETILRVVDLQSGDAVRADAEVPVGAALTLSFDQQRLSPKAGTQIVFVVSAGQVDDGLRCGPGGAQLQCSSCGETWPRQRGNRRSSFSSTTRVSSSRLTSPPSSTTALM